MEARMIAPKDLAAMLGVCLNTAKAHMRKHPLCINVGLGGKEYLRLPIEAAEEIVSGIRPLSPIADKPKVTQKAKGKPKVGKKPIPRYVPYR